MNLQEFKDRYASMACWSCGRNDSLTIEFAGAYRTATQEIDYDDADDFRPFAACSCGGDLLVTASELERDRETLRRFRAGDFDKVLAATPLHPRANDGASYMPPSFFEHKTLLDRLRFDDSNGWRSSVRERNIIFAINSIGANP